MERRPEAGLVVLLIIATCVFAVLSVIMFWERAKSLPATVA
jgi:hypothetical protein